MIWWFSGCYWFQLNVSQPFWITTFTWKYDIPNFFNLFNYLTSIIIRHYSPWTRWKWRLHSQNFMDTAKTMDLTRLCIHTNKQSMQYFFYTHTHIKLIKELKTKTMSTVNMMYLRFILSNTIFCISLCWTMAMHCRILHQK